MDVWVTAIVNEFFRKDFCKTESRVEYDRKKALQWLKTKYLEGKDVIQEASVFLSF